MKEELVLALVDLSDLSLSDDGSQQSLDEWVNLVDRGGLCHILNETFMVFNAVEVEVRRHLTLSKVRQMTPGFKDKLTSNISLNKDVLFYWSMLSIELDQEEEKTLLTMIINLWVTIRGFSFANSWIEIFKQASKKGTQKAKALRSEVA